MEKNAFLFTFLFFFYYFLDDLRLQKKWLKDHLSLDLCL